MEKLAFPIIDTGLTKFYGPKGEIPRPKPVEPFYGQDAQYRGILPAYQDNGDGHCNGSEYRAHVAKDYRRKT